MSQEQKSPQRSSQDQEQEQIPEVTTDAEKKEGIDEDVDAILADIDGVLEENAQAFVEAYIQKGGQ